MQDRADALFALSILSNRSAKGTEVGLMMELAQRRFWCIRKPESERLAYMEGATISRIIERCTDNPHIQEELSPLELALTSFLLSDTVQLYQT